MANQFSATGALDLSHPIDALDKSIDVLWMRRNEFVGNSAQFFDVDNKTAGVDHVISSVGSALSLPPRVGSDTEQPAWLTPADGFKKTITVITRKSGIRVTQEMLESDRFSVIVGMTQGQMKSAMQSDEYERISIFDNAFTGTDGADAQPLCSNSHPQENPEVAVWDNLGTGALTGPNLQALRLVARQMTNEQGDPDPVKPMKLFVPNDLEQKALELTRAVGKPETDLNEPNVLVNGFSVVVSDYLSSASAYFIVGDRTGPDKGLCEVVLADWSITDWNEPNPHIPIAKVLRARKVFDFTVSKNIVGSAG